MIVDAAELLRQLLLQDVKRGGDGDDDDGEVSLKDQVSKDRILSVHDPEMRHGHKSSSRRFDGQKAAVVVDTDSQLITAVDVLPGNAWDSMGALQLVEQSEVSAGAPVDEAMGDAAVAVGGIRQEFADGECRLVARIPGRPNRKHFPREDFVIHQARGTCTGPAGQVARHMAHMATRTDLTGRVYKPEGFRFDGAKCAAAPLDTHDSVLWLTFSKSAGYGFSRIGCTIFPKLRSPALIEPLEAIHPGLCIRFPRYIIRIAAPYGSGMNTDGSGGGTV